MREEEKEKKIVTLRKRKNLFRIPIRFIEKKIEKKKKVLQLRFMAVYKAELVIRLILVCWEVYK